MHSPPEWVQILLKHNYEFHLKPWVRVYTPKISEYTSNHCFTFISRNIYKTTVLRLSHQIYVKQLFDVYLTKYTRNRCCTFISPNIRETVVSRIFGEINPFFFTYIWRDKRKTVVSRIFGEKNPFFSRIFGEINVKPLFHVYLAR